MGQFKYNEKMDSDEEKVVLKLKKGGSAKLKMNPGGPVPAMPLRGAMRPALQQAAPRMAPPAAALLRRKEGGEAKEDAKADKKQDVAMLKKAFKQHDAQEHKGSKGTDLKLKKGGKMATGGVANAQGGYKTGGVAKGNAGGYKTGGVAKGNAGGYKTGGVVNGQGGYKTGGFASMDKTCGKGTASGFSKMKKGGMC